MVDLPLRKLSFQGTKAQRYPSSGLSTFQGHGGRWRIRPVAYPSCGEFACCPSLLWPELNDDGRVITKIKKRFKRFKHLLRQREQRTPRAFDGGRKWNSGEFPFASLRLFSLIGRYIRHTRATVKRITSIKVWLLSSERSCQRMSLSERTRWLCYSAFGVYRAYIVELSLARMFISSTLPSLPAPRTLKTLETL